MVSWHCELLKGTVCRGVDVGTGLDVCPEAHIAPSLDEKLESFPLPVIATMRETERTDSVSEQFLSLPWPAPDPLVAHDDDPLVVTRDWQPYVVVGAWIGNWAARSARIEYVITNQRQGPGDVELDAGVEVVDSVKPPCSTPSGGLP